MDPFTEVSLFSGGGGGLLATQHFLGFKTICYCEIAKFQQRSLKTRIKEGLLDDAPIWDDVRTFDGRPWRGLVDILTGGFPCQGYSSAGNRTGADHPLNLWPDTIRVIREIWPPWILLENVADLLSYDYVGRIFADLAEAGYDYRWASIPAFVVGAPHLRERLWIIAHTAGLRRILAPHVKDTKADWERRHFDGVSWWQTEPEVGRVAHGLARGMGRALVATGEGMVPFVLAEAWTRMVGETKEGAE
jgi:DNA (cytosine-5)-methyltransferase 1